MYSTVLLEQICPGCFQHIRYIARIYTKAVEISTTFNQLPKYLGTCLLSIEDSHVHISALSISEGAFTRKHYLDLCLRILEAQPMVSTASWERHKTNSVVQRSIRIVDAIRNLTKVQNENFSNLP